MVQLICYAQRQVVRSAQYVQRIKFLNMQAMWQGQDEYRMAS